MTADARDQVIEDLADALVAAWRDRDRAYAEAATYRELCQVSLARQADLWQRLRRLEDQRARQRRAVSPHRPR